MDDENVEKVEKRGVMVDVDGIDEEGVQNMCDGFSFFGVVSLQRETEFFLSYIIDNT